MSRGLWSHWNSGVPKPLHSLQVWAQKHLCVSFAFSRSIQVLQSPFLPDDKLATRDVFSEEAPLAWQFQADNSGFSWEYPAIQGGVMSPRFFCTEVKVETCVFWVVFCFLQGTGTLEMQFILLHSNYFICRRSHSLHPSTNGSRAPGDCPTHCHTVHQTCFYMSLVCSLRLLIVPKHFFFMKAIQFSFLWTSGPSLPLQAPNCHTV